MRLTDYERRAAPALEWLDRQCEMALEAFQEGRRVMFEAPEALRYFVDCHYTRFETPRQWAETHPSELQIIVEAYGHRFDPPKRAPAAEISAPRVEGYAGVRSLAEHVAFIEDAKVAAQLKAKLARVSELSLDELEGIMAAIEARLELKKAVERDVLAMTADELAAALELLGEELRRRRAEIAAEEKKKAEQGKAKITHESASPPSRGELTDLSGSTDAAWEKI
jgi:hypothetical protein